jgi:hypothetical protein
MKLTEERSTNIMTIVKQLRGIEFIEDIIDVKGMTDGFTVFARGSDGNAYEFQIRPAASAKDHKNLRKEDKYIERKKKRREELRKKFNME